MSGLRSGRKEDTPERNIKPALRWVIATAVVLIIFILVVAAAAHLVTLPLSTPGTGPLADPTLTICISSIDVFPAEHIHSYLVIIINGEPITIPANIGITETCIRPVHTHDSSGMIHVESPVSYPYTLHDFFLVWGFPFDSTHIMSYQVDSTHTLSMTVNGVANAQYQNYVMHDQDRIVITYSGSS